MKFREINDYINDLIESCEDILTFTENMSYADFSSDKKTVLAVIRCLEVIGEATKKIPPSLRLKHPTIPWRQMAGMRDKLIHEYFGVDIHMVWEVVKNHIPQIFPLIKSISVK